MLDNLEKYKVILASGSPRRRELMAGLGVNYEVRILPDVDESYPDTLQGEEIPLYTCSVRIYRKYDHQKQAKQYDRDFLGR